LKRAWQRLPIAALRTERFKDYVAAVSHHGFGSHQNLKRQSMYDDSEVKRLRMERQLACSV